MIEDKETIEREFYQRCADLLALKYEYKKFPYKKRTRWNNRRPGNGRFEGFGLIRMFSPSLIHVSSYYGNKIFKSVEDVYEFIKGLS